MPWNSWRASPAGATLLRRVALDVVAADQIEHQIGRTGDPVVQAFAALGTECRDRFVGGVPAIDRNDLTVVAPRRAMTRLFGLYQDDIGATLRQMQGR